MKRRLPILLLAGLLLFPVLTFAELTGEEAAFLTKCYENVDPEKGKLSVVTAVECVEGLNADNAALLNRFRQEDPGTAADVVAFNNALLDLKGIVTKNEGRAAAKHLARVLEKYTCPLCTMGLGPRPEKAFDWIGREAGEALPGVKEAVRTWDALGPVRAGPLSGSELYGVTYSYDAEKWNAQPIMKRYGVLGSWAEAETRRLIALYFAAKFKMEKPDPQLTATLRLDLICADEYVSLKKLDALLAELGKQGTGAAAPADDKAGNLAGAASNIGELKNRSEADQAAYLSGTFDQAGLNPGDVHGAGSASAVRQVGFVHRALSPQETARLSGRLITSDAKGNLKGPIAEELKGTRAGEEILAFYKDPAYAKARTNRLDFGFEKMRPGMYGGWSSSARTTKLNSELVNDWMRANKVRPEQLFQGEPSKNGHLKELSEYLTPTFVHEATHQRQIAWAAANGFMYSRYPDDPGYRVPYQMENETEALSMDSSFMAEKIRQCGPAYAAKLDDFDKDNTRLFIEGGVDAVRLANHRNYYSRLESSEGSAAKEFSSASAAVKEFKPLEEKYRTAPGSMSPVEVERFRELKEAMDIRFKWYAMTYRKSADDEAKLNGWRKEINGKLYPSRSVGAAAPPELL